MLGAVRLMMHNILEGGVTHGGRLEPILDLIGDIRPDVLVLNECNGFETDGHRTLHRFEVELGMRGVLAETRSGFHVALFVRDMPIVESHVMTDWFHHAALRVKVVCRGQPLTLMGTHLCPFSAEARVREAQYLASHVREPHTILMGDLNAISPHDAGRVALEGLLPHRRSRQLLPGTETVDTRAVAVLESAGLVDLWHQAHPEAPGCTLPTPLVDGTSDPVLRFDYMLATHTVAQKLRHIRVLDDEVTRSVSDHFPVLAELDP